MSQSSRPMQGFTLVELLVAVAVLALLATLAWGGLATLSRSRAQIEAEHVRLEALSRSFGRFEADLRAALARPVRDEFGASLAALRGEPGYLEFTRGMPTSLIESSGPDLRRVAWQQTGTVLERLVWPTLDRAPGASPVVEAMLPDVTRLELRYIDAQGRSMERWLGAAESLPRAVELRLELQDQGSLRRLIELPVQAEP